MKRILFVSGLIYGRKRKIELLKPEYEIYLYKRLRLIVFRTLYITRPYNSIYRRFLPSQFSNPPPPEKKNPVSPQYRSDSQTTSPHLTLPITPTPASIPGFPCTKNYAFLHTSHPFPHILPRFPYHIQTYQL